MKTAICAIIKNEHRFLKEWIDWHLGLGFDAIHLFEDKGSESHLSICNEYSNVFLRRYEDDRHVQWLLRRQGSSHTQFVLYNWFSNNYKNTYDWVAFIDIDEFINFSPDYNLGKLCEEFNPYSAVLLNWKMMGASGHIQRPDCGVVEAYTNPCNFPKRDYCWGHKSFVNLNKFEGFFNLHKAKNFVTTHHTTNHLDHFYDKAWLNHYFTKSWEDWCDRIFNRGGTYAGHRTLAQFFECNTDMEYLREDLIYSVSDRIPRGTYWLDKELGITAGGNIRKISKINNK